MSAADDDLAAVRLEAKFGERPHDERWGKALDRARDVYRLVIAAERVLADSDHVLAELLMRTVDDAIAERRFEMLTESKIMVEGAIVQVERLQAKSNAEVREWVNRLVK